jgi:hypothetical protein
MQKLSSSTVHSMRASLQPPLPSRTAAAPLCSDTSGTYSSTTWTPPQTTSGLKVLRRPCSCICGASLGMNARSMHCVLHSRCSTALQIQQPCSVLGSPPPNWQCSGQKHQNCCIFLSENELVIFVVLVRQAKLASHQPGCIGALVDLLS